MATTYVKDMNLRPRYAPAPPSTVQRLLDDNTALIQSICELQSAGRMSEAAEYQQTLHRNLIYLASLAEDAQSLLAELQMPPDQPTPAVSHPQTAESNATVKSEPPEKNESKQVNVANQNLSTLTEQQIRIQHNPMAPNPGNPYFNAAEMQPAMQAQYQQQQQVQPAVSAPPQQMQHTAQNPTTAAASHPIAPVSSSVTVQQHVPPTTVYIQQQQSGQQIYYHQQYQQGAPGQQMYGAMQQIPHQQAPPRPVDSNATYYQHQPRYQQYQIYQQQQQQQAPLQPQQLGQQQPYIPAPQQPPQVMYATSSSSHRPSYVQQNEIPQQQQQVTYAAYGQPSQQQMYAPQQSYAPQQQQQQQQQP